jgi:hypothetical protein
MRASRLKGPLWVCGSEPLRAVRLRWRDNEATRHCPMGRARRCVGHDTNIFCKGDGSNGCYA